MTKEQILARHEAEMNRKETAESQQLVEVFSRQMIDAGHGRGGVLISILQPATGFELSSATDMVNVKSPDSKHWRKVLTLRFLDSTPSERFDALFDEAHARQVWDFINDVEFSETINIHCTAGISRSVGVGVVLADALCRNIVVHTGVGIQFANPHVLALMRREMWNNRLTNKTYSPNEK